MDRKKRLCWPALLPVCVALVSGCDGRSSQAPEAGAPTASAPKAAQAARGEPIASEPARLPSSVLAAGYRGQAPGAALSEADPDARFGAPSTDLTDPGARWLESAESAPPEPTAAPPLPSDSESQEDSQAALPVAKIRQPIGIESQYEPEDASQEIADAPTDSALPAETASEAPPAAEALSSAVPPAARSVPIASVTLPQTAAPPVAAPAAETRSIEASVGDAVVADELSAEFPPDRAVVQQPIVVPPSPPSAAVAAPQEPIPWAKTQSRSKEMETVSQSAEALVREGFRLAERGAVYSARLKFFAALSLISRSLDIEQQTQVYSRALVAGRTALSEAWDFRTDGVPRNVDMARIAATHRTKVLADAQLDSLSPIAAQQRYFSFAQEQLALAAGNEPAGSMALFGLGKTAAVVQGSGDSKNLTLAGEQMACYQAAMIADPRNFCAMHELGVVLASHGRWEAARDLFLSALAISENAATWRNLSVVWDQLGDPQQALRAAQRADKLTSTRIGEMTGSNLRWVDPQTFAKAVPPSEGLIAPAAPSAPPQSAPTTAASKKRTAMWPWKQESVR